MKPETTVEFDNPETISKDKAGRPISRFSHDAETMDVASPFKLYDEFMDAHTLCKGKIEHLTVFAGGGVSPLKTAQDLTRMYGGKPEGWKHVKGIGRVADGKGNEYEADIHWFENADVGQVGWKIKQPRGDMGEGQVYWKSK